MARRTGLIASIVLVLAVHAALLHWLASVVPRPDRLLPMATPVFTRLLQPQTPPVAVTSPSSRPNRPATRTETAQAAIELIATPASDSAPVSTSDAGAATVTVADMAPAAMPVSGPEAATAPETPATDPLAGWPVAFWLASQGLILMFVALVVVWVRWDADPPAEGGLP